MKQVNDEFITWVLGGSSSTKEAGGRVGIAQIIQKSVPIEETPDLYGEEPTVHEGAYQVSGNQIEKIASVLISAGWKRENNKLRKGNAVVELGTDEDSTFVYISDGVE